MGNSLFEYLRIKVHPVILSQDWSRISVIGKHERQGTSCVSPIEKEDKPFNWQRPTTVLKDGDAVYLQCFPGHDYVQHYAAIVATQLALQGKSPEVVQYCLPNSIECMQPLLESNLVEMGPVDIVVMGYVQGLERFTSSHWEGGGKDTLFGWQKLPLPHGGAVAFLGCRVSFWGDIAGNVLRALVDTNSVKCVLYVGKLGSLRPEHSPNEWLASGTNSLVLGEPITWTNVLKPFLQKSSKVVEGDHVTMPSVLDETRNWLSEHREKYDFVDPEIGHMAKASLERGIHFGYLHIISDNVARKYDHDLSNERLGGVISDRKGLLGDIQDILEQFFAQWVEL